MRKAGDQTRRARHRMTARYDGSLTPHSFHTCPGCARRARRERYSGPSATSRISEVQGVHWKGPFFQYRACPCLIGREARTSKVVRRLPAQLYKRVPRCIRIEYEWSPAPSDHPQRVRRQRYGGPERSHPFGRVRSVHRQRESQDHARTRPGDLIVRGPEPVHIHRLLATEKNVVVEDPLGAVIESITVVFASFPIDVLGHLTEGHEVQTNNLSV